MCLTLSSEELSTELNKGAAITREYNSAKEVASSFSSFSLTSNDKEEVPQLVSKRRMVVDPVLVLNLDSEDSNDLGSDQL